MDEETFKKMKREEYKEFDLYMLWDAYTAMKKQSADYKKHGWEEDAKESKLEMIVLVSLMRKKPHPIKANLYNELHGERINNVHYSLENFSKDMEDVEFFKNEILNRAEN
ncbi:MAG: hypothetical protein V1660_01010 [archaeon]